MRRWLVAPTRWVRDLFAPEQPKAAHHAGDLQLVLGDEALVATQSSICEAIYRPAVSTGPGEPFRFRQPASGGPLNAFAQGVADNFTSGSQGALAAVVGSALCGIRSAGMYPCDVLAEARSQLCAAAERRIPLVLNATCQAFAQQAVGASSGHGSYHSLADTGALLFMAGDLQQAVDLTLVAWRVAELALGPAVVALDGPEAAWAFQQVRLPPSELVKQFVGDPGQDISSPTPAQVMVFGDRRRRMPRWFDLDRPILHGACLSGPDVGAALAAQQVFFADHVPQMAQEAMKELTELTGRPLSVVNSYRTDDADYVLAVQGAAVQLAQAVVDDFRTRLGVKVGVLGVTCLRPFPGAEVQRALRKARVITVLERVDPVLGGQLPLMADIRAALPNVSAKLLSATYGMGGQPVTAAQFAAVCENMLDRTEARTALRLGISVPEPRSAYPKRQVHLQNVESAYPGLAQLTMPTDAAVDVRPAGARTATLYARAEEASEAGFRHLCTSLSQTCGPHLRTRSLRFPSGAWKARVTVLGEPFFDPGDDTPVELCLISGPELCAGIRPLSELCAGGSVVIACDQEPPLLWAALPASFRADVQEREAHVYAVQGGVDELTTHGVSLLTEPSDALMEISWRNLTEPPEVEQEAELPMAVRRYADARSTYDSLPRFWGEFAQPRVEGEASAQGPDPFLALGVVPPCTATFHDMSRTRLQVPVIDAERCTGCGKCWAACSDAAIASVAIGTEALLNAAADRAAEVGEASGPAAGKLRRALRQLASRLDALLAKSEASVVPEELLKEAFEWLVSKMSLSEEELPAVEQAFEATSSILKTLPLSITESFFRGPHSKSKGSGQLLMLAVNAQACQGCGACAAICPDEAIGMQPQTEQAVQRMRANWRSWEQLPDTPGDSIWNISQMPDVGALPAVLMSRHCQLSMCGGDGAEPGSGQRLATRQVVAVIEYQMQRRMSAFVDRLDELSGQLREVIRKVTAESIPVQELGPLAAALEQAPNRPANLGEVIAHLAELGHRSTVDVRALQRLVRTTEEVEQLRFQVVKGLDGVGRARFGVVAAGETVGEWAASFPRNPFAAPVAADPTGDGAELAAGIAQGLLNQRRDEARLLRRAELLLQAPSDLSARLKELDALSPEQLTSEELELAAPLLLVVGAEVVSGQGLSGLSRLLMGRLPVKILLLGEGELLAGGADPSLAALGHRGAYVVSTSVAHGQHLFDGVSGAIEYMGPALIHMYAPSPRRHGFSAQLTVARAAMAVHCRVHPLLRYDPGQQGVFGSRLSLEGNPALENSWASSEQGQTLTPAYWAATERRFAAQLTRLEEGAAGVSIHEWCALAAAERAAKIPIINGGHDKNLAVGAALAAASVERQEAWQTLQELAGVVTPFTESVRAELQVELDKAHQDQLAQLRKEHEVQLAELRASQLAEQAAKLRDRLLQLAMAGAGGDKRSTERGNLQ